ncbi:uncharacterized protein LOC108677846, partial [Hyalella azteca]|uniref:Uncharacterized protein LOC108677846 n=1 Tax=Hyalella azteca TaxID=294128 RepID=A0A8B7P6F7_HYAAZ
MASQAGCDDIEQSLLTTDEQGYTALHHAVMASDLATLKKLLSYADERCVNMESHDRSTALLLLCKRFTPESQTDLQTEEEILVSLLAAGANPNLPQPDPVSLPLFAGFSRLDHVGSLGCGVLVHKLLHDILNLPAYCSSLCE